MEALGPNRVGRKGKAGAAADYFSVRCENFGRKQYLYSKYGGITLPTHSTITMAGLSVSKSRSVVLEFFIRNAEHDGMTN